MQLNFSQHMKMSQQMKLAPRMIQSMEILQLPVLALNERIEQELSENVVLEMADASAEAPETELAANSEQAKDEAAGETLERQELVVENDRDNEADFERLVEMSAEWSDDRFETGSRSSGNRIEEDGDRQHDAMANAVSRPPSLIEHLLEQFGFFTCRPEIRDFGEFLIQNLDADGRLRGKLDDLRQVYGRPIEVDDAEEALRLIQRLEPPGVGARDLSECLLLQLTPETRFRDVLQVLIAHHLEDIAANRIPQIQRKTGFDIDVVKFAIDELQHLDPHPGRTFDVEPSQNVTPDIAVEIDDDGKYVVRLLDEYTPSLRISPYYIKQLRNNPDAQTKEYIKKKIESAKWLIESIEQRNNTVRKVAQAIVDHQKEFLDKGPEFIAPLKMQQIADQVGVHVTTVSRAVDDKWIQTPRGLFPLKRFFGGGTQTADGEEVSWDIIRIKLKEIVDAEDKNDPLSDDALVDELSKQGYTLARRTVTKYRKLLDIPSSRQRRVY
jgi:RNA polymerase sigma-54 factor